MFMKKRSGHGNRFWNDEYKKEHHFSLSMTQSEDLEKFTRWLIRKQGKTLFNITQSVLDLGCGNGRNIAWLVKTFSMHGIGYDTSSSGIAYARQYAEKNSLPITYEVRSISETSMIPDESQALVLDMMTSHFLTQEERVSLIKEIIRVLKPGGFLFYKTFLLDGDQHAYRLIQENPWKEENTYIHPKIGAHEHVMTEKEIEKMYSVGLNILKIYKSHRHKGKNAKRRSVIVYMQKPEF
jgi:SAM-dependent methyltransferase